MQENKWLVLRKDLHEFPIDYVTYVIQLILYLYPTFISPMSYI